MVSIPPLIDFFSILKGFTVLEAFAAAESANTHYKDSRQAAEQKRYLPLELFRGLVLYFFVLSEHELVSVCSVKAAL